MQLSDAVEIKELFGADMVNEALRDGWVLLAATSAHRTDEVIDVCYTLGRGKAFGSGSPIGVSSVGLARRR